MLLLTATHLSVPALTGAIMTMGVATANSILIVSFARQRMNDGLDPSEAALDAGATRIRPVLMTALAMIIGMIPMALGWGEGAEQNAPLGSGGDRRAAVRDGLDAVFRAGGICGRAPATRAAQAVALLDAGDRRRESLTWWTKFPGC